MHGLTARVDAAHQARHAWLLREAELMLQIDELRLARIEPSEESSRGATSPHGSMGGSSNAPHGSRPLEDVPRDSPIDLPGPGVVGLLPPLPLHAPSLEEVATLAEASVAHVGSLADTLRTQASDYLREWYEAVSESQTQYEPVMKEVAPAPQSAALESRERVSGASSEPGVTIGSYY